MLTHGPSAYLKYREKVLYELASKAEKLASVNRQHKWNTIETIINGQLGACSCYLEEVK